MSRFSNRAISLCAVVWSSVLMSGLAGAAPAESIVLQYAMSGVGLEEREIREAQAKAFEALHPNMRIEFIWSEGERLEKLVTLFGAGTPPDIVYMNEWIAELARAGMLEPLDTYVQKDRVNLDAFFPPVLEIGRYQGKLYALPQEISPLTIYYNRDLVAQTGLAAPNDDWSWAQFLEHAKKLTRSDARQTRWGYWPENWWGGWGPFIYTNNGRVWSKDFSRAAVGETQTIEAIEFIVRMMHQHQVSPPPAQMNEWSVESFLKGNTAMVSAGMWVLPMFVKDPPNFAWDVAVWPNNGRTATVAAILSYGISSQSKHKGEAWEFIKFMTMTPEGQNFVGSTGMALPTLRSRRALESYFTFAKKTPMRNPEAFVRGAEISEFEMFAASFSKAHEILWNQIQKAFTAEMAVRPAMEEAAGRLNVLLQQ